MNPHDANPALSAFTVVIGVVLGIVVAVALGFGALGVLVSVVVGVLAVGAVATTLGIVRDPRGGERPDDLPSEYDDY